jgi:hypothetical protein
MLNFNETYLDEYSDEQLLDFLDNTETPLTPPPCVTSLLSPNS